MEDKTLNYAMKNIETIYLNEVKPFINQGRIYLEFKDGRNLRISDDEIIYQATEYLRSEINRIESM